MAFNYRKFIAGLFIKPKASSDNAALGDIEVLSSDNKIHIHNGTTNSALVTESHSATLTSKTIDADSNTITNIDNNEIKAAAGIDATKLGAGTVDNTELGYLDGVTSAIQTQLNAKQTTTLANGKILIGSGGVATAVTVSGDATISTAGDLQIATGVIVDGDINASAAIDASKIANGTVSSTEFQFLDGVTSAIQTQINTKAATSALTTHTGASSGVHGVTGSVVGTTDTQVLTGKTIDGDDNTVQDLPLTAIKTVLADATKFISRDAAGIPTSVKAVPTGVVVGTTDTQVLTNKDHDGGTASNTSRITVPSGTKSALDALTRKEATIVYATDTDKLYTDDGTTLNAIGSGTGGINYITATDGTVITGWATYKDADQAAPENGTGGSPVSTFAVSTDSSLVGTTNFLWSKTGSTSRRGEGFSYDFSIDQGYQSKPLTISMLYKVASGTYVDDDMTVWIYDVTNAVLIQPSPYTIKNVSGSAIQKCEFQASSNSTSYRLIVQTASTSAANYTLRFDSVSVSPNTYNTGAVVTDFINTRTFTPSAGFGTTTGGNYWTRRVGDSLEVEGYFTCGTVAASTASLTLPSGLSIDSSKLGSGSNSSILGEYVAQPTAASGALTNGVGGIVFYDGSDTAKVYVGYQSGGGTLFVKANGNSIAVNSLGVGFKFTVPILGWGTSQVLSSDTATNVVDFYGTKSGTQAITANVTDITFNASKDSNGAWSGSVYTVPVSGDYHLSYAGFAPSTAVNLDWKVYKNGTGYKVISTSPSGNYCSGHILMTGMIAGDTISVRGSGSITVLADAVLSIARVSGPAQIAASEKIYLQYTGNAGTSITANVTNTDWSTKVTDSHGAWNGTTFTAPRPGWYNINGGWLVTTNTGATPQLYIDGTQTYSFGNDASTDRKGFMFGRYFTAGQTATIRMNVSATLSNNAIFHWISITSQG